MKVFIIMKLTWQCLFSPRLHKIYRDGRSDMPYQPLFLEKWGDKMLVMANYIMNIGIYTSPFICMYVYKRGWSAVWDGQTIVQVFGSISCLVALSFLVRGYGRATDPRYVKFIKAFNNTSVNQSTYLQGIRKYDFDYYAWPVSFSMPPKERQPWVNPFYPCANDNLPFYQRIPIQVLAYIAIHTFGLRLIYPGSLGLVHGLLWAHLQTGRTQLVEEFNGKRSKLVTADKNTIDTMFVDQRQQSTEGGTLVICSEGNSGFYEIGIMATPIKCGYSTLGWNHPGFASSSGLPYPSQEQNAVDAVMQYAIQELKFLPENIILFGWSIGGYAATWAAVNYPIKALVLDATFDDLLPLAENHMPSSWSLLVKEAVRTHVDLNIAEMLKKYNGSLQLIRRTDDEIICLRQGNISTNRGNYLLMKIVEHRHLDLLEELDNGKETLTRLLALTDMQRAAIDYNNAPVSKQALMRLISLYMRDIKSTHCVPLPDHDFQAALDNIGRRA